jgi:MoaA/NifB/PqqE/SkfB family radical SAM enzyme
MLPVDTEPAYLPEAYKLPSGCSRGALAPVPPAVVSIEATNRCNLACRTCPHPGDTAEAGSEPPDLDIDRLQALLGARPSFRRALLHGMGEPLLNRELPRLIAFLKEQGSFVAIDSNGLLLTPEAQRELVESGLDELRCSVNAARSDTYAAAHGADALVQVAEGLRGLRDVRTRAGLPAPAISVRTLATTTALAELPALVRWAAAAGADECYLQRYVYLPGSTAAQTAVYGKQRPYLDEILSECEAISVELGLKLRAAGGRDPRQSLGTAQPATARPWRACVRPWTMAYLTVQGDAYPCNLAPLAFPGEPRLVLGNAFETPLEELWNGEAYRRFRLALLSNDPPFCCTHCGVDWSL